MLRALVQFFCSPSPPQPLDVFWAGGGRRDSESFVGYQRNCCCHAVSRFEEDDTRDSDVVRGRPLRHELVEEHMLVFLDDCHPEARGSVDRGFWAFGELFGVIAFSVRCSAVKVETGMPSSGSLQGIYFFQ